MLVGVGYDVHSLVEGRRLILGGVEIPSAVGLLGHSDADVLAHAIGDALLGAACLDDIGTHFPDTDERYRGISSLLLLNSIQEKLRQRDLEIVHIDSVIIAQSPKLQPYKGQMKEKIAQALKIEPHQVNIKATTTEGLGFTGRQEGMAAQAIACLRPKSHG